jgi:hypothetical protein
MIISAHDDNISAPPRLTLLVHLCFFYISSFKRQGPGSKTKMHFEHTKSGLKGIQLSDFTLSFHFPGYAENSGKHCWCNFFCHKKVF